MIIEVKGSKPVNPDTEDSHERYVLKNQDKRSNVPLFFTILLTGLALYLKSAFPRFANSVAESEDKKPPEPSELGRPKRGCKARYFGSSHRLRGRGRSQESAARFRRALALFCEFALRA